MLAITEDQIISNLKAFNPDFSLIKQYDGGYALFDGSKHVETFSAGMTLKSLYQYIEGFCMGVAYTGDPRSLDELEGDAAGYHAA